MRLTHVQSTINDKKKFDVLVSIEGVLRVIAVRMACSQRRHVSSSTPSKSWPLRPVLSVELGTVGPFCIRFTWNMQMGRCSESRCMYVAMFGWLHWYLSQEYWGFVTCLYRCRWLLILDGRHGYYFTLLKIRIACSCETLAWNGIMMLWSSVIVWVNHVSRLN